MLGQIPEPLDESFRDVLIEIARANRLTSIAEPDALAKHVELLTRAYNDPELRGLNSDHRSARLGFWFARDVPKVAGAVREVIRQGRLRIPITRPLRVLDLGAGLGASHRGLARALAAASFQGTIDVLAVDEDRAALDLATQIVARRTNEGNVVIRLETQVSDVASWMSALSARSQFDVIIVGQLISELGQPETHAKLLHDWFLHTNRDGMMIVVEPALRTRSRHLQELRGELIGTGVTILAPCLHSGRCPLLGRATDWCHEDLPVDLPSWLIPIARRSGLRFQGLTYSYLVLAHHGPTVREFLASSYVGTDDVALERAVSDLLVSKGKREAILCGDPLRGDDVYGNYGTRIGRLDRDASAANHVFDDLARGEIVSIQRPLDDKGRVSKEKKLIRCT